jgi:2-hydroxychromene-2-carboxylate isomerase
MLSFHSRRLALSKTIDYYFPPQSPWAYLGHARFVALAEASGSIVRVLPADFGKVFSVSGGLPLSKRAPQRQAYRLVEMQRFADYLQVPMHVQPQFFPVQGDDAARLIIAVDVADGAAAALRMTGAVMSAVWAEQRDIADPTVLAQLLTENGLDAARWEQSRAPAIAHQYERNTQAAIDAGVFGGPSYCVDGEIFWGQDRLDFLQRKLAEK